MNIVAVASVIISLMLVSYILIKQKVSVTPTLRALLVLAIFLAIVLVVNEAIPAIGLLTVWVQPTIIALSFLIVGLAARQSAHDQPSRTPRH